MITTPTFSSIMLFSSLARDGLVNNSSYYNRHNPPAALDHVSCQSDDGYCRWQLEARSNCLSHRATARFHDLCYLIDPFNRELGVATPRKRALDLQLDELLFPGSTLDWAKHVG